MSHLYGSMILYIGIWYQTRMDRKNSSRKFPQQKNIMTYMKVQRSSTPTSNHPRANLCLFKFQSTLEFSKSEGSGCKRAKLPSYRNLNPSWSAPFSANSCVPKAEFISRSRALWVLKALWAASEINPNWRVSCILFKSCHVSRVYC